MKTRDRILQTSRALFNEEGEAQQTAVDIADALNISPGNLYYHFKGKDAIIHTLFEEFEAEMLMILRGSHGAISSVQDSWVYLYIILEEIYDFRFFYRNLGALLARYPDLSYRFGVLMGEKRKAIKTLLDDLSSANQVKISPILSDMLEEQMLMSATFWLSKDQIEGHKLTSGHLIHRTVYQMIMLIVPYMGEAGFSALNALTAYYEAAIDKDG